jgi:hypothetical protein
MQQRRKTREEEGYTRLRGERRVFIKKEERLVCEKVETCGNSNILYKYKWYEK